MTQRTGRIDAGGWLSLRIIGTAGADRAELRKVMVAPIASKGRRYKSFFILVEYITGGREPCG
jgi:hypothetical protein